MTRQSRVQFLVGSDHLCVGKSPQHFTKPSRTTQPPTLSGMGNEYQPVW